MLSKVNAASVQGISGEAVTVEVDINRRGFPVFKIVGLPHKSIAESRERVRSAVKNSGYRIPQAKIIVNLAPAHVPKRGSLFDMAIALGILASDGIIRRSELHKSMFIGELSLDGSVASVPGILPIVLFARKQGYSSIFIPKGSIEEVTYISGIEILPVKNLCELVEHLVGKKRIQAHIPKAWQRKERQKNEADAFDNIRGHDDAKRAMVISAAGAHNVFLEGPPGTGKTLLAKAMLCILPELSYEEYLQVMVIRSIDRHQNAVYKNRPFRAPHHTISPSGLIGGGALLKQGEITRAHNGILFLDELPEFSRACIDGLRQPLEEHVVTHTRVRGTITLPARSTLVATANPCPCGYYGHSLRECMCTQQQIHNYRKKISGPVRDRIDIFQYVPDVKQSALTRTNTHMQSQDVRERISQAHAIQKQRFGKSYKKNGHMSHSDISALCILDSQAKEVLKLAYRRLPLSARGYFKTIKIAQTIADLDKQQTIQEKHMLEAIQYRSLH